MAAVEQVQVLERGVDPAASSQAAIASPKSVIEERLRAEEAHLVREAQSLERQVLQLRATKASAIAARERADAQRAAESELHAWQQTLRAEVERAIERLNVQRQQQLDECNAFEQKLQQNIYSMLAMQQNVRSRAQALDASFDASIQRLNALFLEAVARRAQAAGVNDAASIEAANEGSVAGIGGAVAMTLVNE
eukprot:2962215-Prymnesium_polylepis.1